jgi:hypothetical protein
MNHSIVISRNRADQARGTIDRHNLINILMQPNPLRLRRHHRQARRSEKEKEFDLQFYKLEFYL